MLGYGAVSLDLTSGCEGNGFKLAVEEGGTKAQMKRHLVLCYLFIHSLLLFFKLDLMVKYREYLVAF